VVLKDEKVVGSKCFIIIFSEDLASCDKKLSSIQ